MSKQRFRVGYVEPAMYPSFEQTANADPAIELVRIAVDASVDEALRLLADCQGFCVKASRDELPKGLHVTAALLEKLPKLALAVSYGAGYDTIDVAACSAAGVGVVNQSGGNARAVAEHVVGMMLVLLKRIPEAHVATRAGTVVKREDLMGRELANRTIGVVGIGNAGGQAALLLKAVGCQVLAYDPYVDAATCAARGATKVELPQLLAQSDAVTLHCPLNAQTRGMFNAERFAAMRPGAIFVSAARGSIHDEGALHQALLSGHIAGAGLDVWEQEPPPADHPLLRHPAVICSPHTAGVTHESRDRVARMAAQAFIAVAQGEDPPRCLNPQVIPAMRKRLEEMGLGRAEA
ncbi:MAG TPA: hydroxyacid dehydrogenase [Burkholderiales bacterium]